MEELIRPYKLKYYRLSPWLRYLSGSLIKYFPDKIRYGSVFRDYSKLLNSSQWWSEEEIVNYQTKELSSLINHAIQFVPYYRQLFNRGRIPEDQSPNILLSLRNIPFLTREDIINHLQELNSDDFKRSSFISTTTGGSTGTPMFFYHQRGLTNPAERAFQWRQRNWAGYHYGNRVVILRGRALGGDKLWVEESSDNALIISSYHLDSKNLPAIVDKIRNFHPIAIQCYPSSGLLIANYLIENHLQPIEGLKTILCGSENLYPFQRNILENVFRCRVYSWYGQTEYVVLAGGCDISDDYHIYPEYGITELIRPDGSVIDGPGEVGEIVGTGFLNYAMPFIRYRTGDLAQYKEGYCDCGRKYRRFEQILGREQEFIVLKDGRIVSLTGLIFGQHFSAFSRIKKFQLRQSVPGYVTVALICSSKFTKSDYYEIEHEFNRCIGGGLSITFEYVDSIPVTAIGKHKHLIQELNINDYFAKKPI